MKTISEYCEVNNLKLVTIRYKHQFGYCKRKGYDIINPSNNAILVSFEPVNYSDDKWYLRNVHHNYNGPRYAKRITSKLLSFINPSETSFFRFA
jgi:hypothetical protein